MSKYFIAPDGADEPTLWEDIPGSDPAVVIRRAELPGRDQDLLWRVLTGVLCADDETVKQVAKALHDDQCGCPSLLHPPLAEHSYQTVARLMLAALAAPRTEAVQ